MLIIFHKHALLYINQQIKINLYTDYIFAKYCKLKKISIQFLFETF